MPRKAKDRDNGIGQRLKEIIIPLIVFLLFIVALTKGTPSLIYSFISIVIVLPALVIISAKKSPKAEKIVPFVSGMLYIVVIGFLLIFVAIVDALNSMLATDLTSLASGDIYSALIAVLLLIVVLYEWSGNKFEGRLKYTATAINTVFVILLGAIAIFIGDTFFGLSIGYTIQISSINGIFLYVLNYAYIIYTRWLR